MNQQTAAHAKQTPPLLGLCSQRWCKDC